MAAWQFWIDRGGTFTDVVARRPDGGIVTTKLLSDDPARDEDAAVVAIRLLTLCGAGDALPACEIRIGTTIATNALLERKGEPVLLAITRGFGDALTIGTQERPDILARQIVRLPPLQAATIEIDERVAADGAILKPIDLQSARKGLADAFERGLRAVAIVLMHGYRYGDHEQALAVLAREIGFEQISVSHEVGALIKLIGRGDTSVVDAYLSPVLRRYVEGLSAALGTPLFMQSNGGLVDGRVFRGKDAILSGPAGGIVGMAATARQAGFDRVIGFDMGGTSTDVSLYAGRYEREGEMVVAGVRIAAPMLRIHTVAAGGGSICRFGAGRLQVGPQSAGAVPGPACYGRGGPLTITDCNLLLGKIQPDHFPRLFGPNGDATLDRAATEARFAELCRAITAATGKPMTPEAAAEGLIAIAVADMAKAIRTISVGRGHDATRFTLACFGGAGGQHACLVADALGIGTVMIHPLAGVLSAYGMGLADRRALRERTLIVPADDHDALSGAAAALAEAAREALVAEGVDSDAIRIETRVHLRNAGTDYLIDVPLGGTDAMRDIFEATHHARFGFAGGGDLIAERLSAEAIVTTPMIDLPPLPATTGPPVAEAETFMAGALHSTPIHARAGIASGDRIAGPAVIVDANATTVIEPGWQAVADAHGNLILTRYLALQSKMGEDGTVDPVRLEIFSGLFMGIAEEMGAALQHSASSVNIRERLDFSCALFDAQGNLIANAPHIPVHLGSMGDSIRTILARRGTSSDGRGIRPGDVYALNAPYDGGTHLPDITVIMPVFAGGTAPFFVAARGHHADIGGISPGSMPPQSRSIEEEGVVIDNLLLVDAGVFREAAVRALLGSGLYPSRAIDMNIADLKAQVAACARGAEGLLRLCADRGAGVVAAYMRHVQDHAEAAVRALIGRLQDGSFTYEMDSGAVVRVVVRVDAESGSAVVDFSGTSPQQQSNFNAPRSVVRAAVLYVMRVLLDEAVPMNDGCLAPVTIVIPEGSMLDPRYPAAVVAGNVEVSQAITDALFGALGVMAASQGTMNNFTFGDERRQYYETIAGGSGAGSGFDGTGVVQTHMTNSRMTDPEILETRFPVLVEAFEIRRGSGGVGAHHGGDGATRRLRFLAPMQAAILANRRRVPPFGLAGGIAGGVGATRVERADGRVETLASTASVEMGVGDVFVIETPGGGGYGHR